MIFFVGEYTSVKFYVWLLGNLPTSDPWKVAALSPSPSKQHICLVWSFKCCCVSMASTSSFAPPKLADFILTERLGSGTYATVYKAYRKVSKWDARENSEKKNQICYCLFLGNSPETHVLTLLCCVYIIVKMKFLLPIVLGNNVCEKLKSSRCN